MAQSYLLKITLRDIKPPVWRRIVVPADIELNELHDAIQVVMGWSDCHLHVFDIDGESYGPTMDDGFGDDIGLDESKYRLSQLVKQKGTKFRYTYDFGDTWEHQIVLEDSEYHNPDWPYPIYCLDGKRACPPEDCGGTWGYHEICQGSTDDDEMYDDFDPNEFDLDEINAAFRIPKQKKKQAKRVAKTPVKKKASKKNVVDESVSAVASSKKSKPGMINVSIEWASEESDDESMSDVESRVNTEVDKLKGIITDTLKKVGTQSSPKELEDAFASAMRDAGLDTRIKVTVSSDDAKIKTPRKSSKKSAKKS